MLWFLFRLTPIWFRCVTQFNVIARRKRRKVETGRSRDLDNYSICIILCIFTLFYYKLWYNKKILCIHLMLLFIFSDVHRRCEDVHWEVMRLGLLIPRVARVTTNVRQRVLHARQLVLFLVVRCNWDSICKWK